MEKYTILAIDDEEHILELLQYNLEANGFEVFTATSIEKAKEILNEKKIEVILLDVMLPDMDGLTALRQFRENVQTKDIPILMVTAKTEEVDRIIGLEFGADDYISKPFSVRELVARVKAIMRREKRSRIIKIEEEKPQVIVFGEIKVDITSHKVYLKGVEVDFTLKEFEILRLLMSNAGKVLNREVLLDKIWGYDYYGETRTVDVHIRYLRAKLKQHGIEDCIETVRGVGYRFTKEPLQ
jgi:two-component system alkaline phosphatase synthesis response regulator PhoP